MTDIGMKWAARIAIAFTDWAESEQKSRTIRISPFDPSPLIEGAFMEAGDVQLGELGKLMGMGVKFDLQSPEAIAWIKEYSSKQIKYISATNQAAIRQIKLRAFQDGLSIGEQQQLIKQYIGLLPQHVVAAQTYLDGLLTDGMDEAAAERLAATYRKQLLNYRAKNIAVSEGMMATNEGVRQTNESAVSRGIVNPEEWEQQWVATGLRNVCDKCQSANGSRSPIGGTFSNGSRGPPIHNSDHCNVILVRRSGFTARQVAPMSEVRKVAEFVPKQTVAEIMDWAKKTYPDTKFFFKDLDVDAMNQTIGKYHELSQRYPEVAKRLEGIGQHGGINSYAGTISGHDKSRDAILLSKDRFGNAKELLSSLKDDVDSKWHPEGTGRVDSVVTHEFGHVIDRHLTAIRPDEIKKFKESVSGIVKWDDMPSRYARENADEAFAEGFSQINFGSELSEYAKRQKAFLEKMFAN